MNGMLEMRILFTLDADHCIYIFCVLLSLGLDLLVKLVQKEIQRIENTHGGFSQLENGAFVVKIVRAKVNTILNQWAYTNRKIIPHIYRIQWRKMRGNDGKRERIQQRMPSLNVFCFILNLYRNENSIAFFTPVTIYIFAFILLCIQKHTHTQNDQQQQQKNYTYTQTQRTHRHRHTGLTTCLEHETKTELTMKTERVHFLP